MEIGVASGLVTLRERENNALAVGETLEQAIPKLEFILKAAKLAQGGDS